MPTAWALQQICSSPKVKAAQESGKFTVLFDSGIRTGSDIIKAIALGANAVLRKFRAVPEMTELTEIVQSVAHSCTAWLWADRKVSKRC